jgi:N-acetylglucosamine transport system permease protein
MNKKKIDWARVRFITMFLSPAVLLYGLFVGGPLFMSFYFSMFRWKGVSTRMTYVGAKNVVQVATDPVMKTAGLNQLMLLVIGGLMLITLGIAIAHALQAKTRLGKSVQAIMLFPQVVSLVIVAIVWRFMWNPSFGVLYGVAKQMHLPMPENGVLGVAGWANAAVLLAFVWHALGFYVMLFSAGLRNLDLEVMEAAHMDGSSGWHRFVTITWPLLWSVKRVAMVYAVANVMGTFALVRLMTNGGPDNATQVFLTYIQEKGWQQSQMGQASTIAMFSFVASLLLGMIAMALVGPNPEKSRKAAAL